MATIPSSATILHLLSGVNWQKDYKHTRYFPTLNDQTNHMLRKERVHTMQNCTFQRVEGKTFLRVNKSIDSLRKTNYVMFKNAEYNNKWFYGFVTQLEYKNRETTHVHFELDVYQTWCKDYTLQPSYVVREHTNMWDSGGNPQINTQDEGLDYGNEYETTTIRHHKPMGSYKWLVMVSKTMMHISNETGEPNPARIGLPQPLSYYLIPFHETTGVPPLFQSGSSASVGISDPMKVLKALYNGDKAVGNIVSIYVTENIGSKAHISKEGSVDKITVNDGVIKKVIVDGADDVAISCLYVASLPKFKWYSEEIVPKMWDHFKPVKESKLMMSPYCMLVIDDLRGNRKEYKPEYLTSNALRLIFKGSLSTSNKTSTSLAYYNTSKMLGSGYDEFVSQEHCIIDNHPNDLPILADHLASFLQGNRNSIQNQRTSIEHSQRANLQQGAIRSAQSVTQGDSFGIASNILSTQAGHKQSIIDLQGIQAKQDDIANVPPNISNMGSNIAYDFGNDLSGVRIMWKQIKNEYIDVLEDFFGMYGYKVNRVKKPNIHTRKNWNYVQTEGVTIKGDFNHEDLESIKAIYDNGITFWQTDDIGNYDLDNGVK